MNALLCRTFGDFNSLSFEAIADPQPQANQVLIKVAACGLSFPDLLILQNKYQFKPELPFVPGGEVSGIIEAVGENVKHLAVGNKVVALCRWGGLAEKVCVDIGRVFKLASNMNFIDGASTYYAYSTSLHALKDRAQLKSGETILILGASGGVGLAAVTLAKSIGATVIAAASTEGKLRICQNFGADFTINYNTQDLRSAINEITNKKGVDVVYDAIGGTLAEPAFRSIAWNGRYLVVGFAAGQINQFPANLPLLKGASIIGVFWSGFAEREPQKNADNIELLNQWINEGRIKTHVHKIYPFADATSALTDLYNRKVVGKAVVQVNSAL